MNKKIIFFICLIAIILSVASVSAAEDVDQTITGDTSNLDTTGDILGISSSENEILGANEIGTFTELQTIINNAGSNPVNLTKDYEWNPEFTDYGININNPITINGNGHYIDALGKIRIFELKATSNVVLNNITLKGGNTDGYGGAINIWDNVNNLKFTNLNFINNSALQNTNNQYGGAIRFRYSAENILFENVTFINNTARADGGAIYFAGTSTSNTFKNVRFENNVAYKNGGALYVLGDSTSDTFENVTFINNRANTEDGGAINFKKIDRATFNNVIFYKNQNPRAGGAINFDNGLTNSKFNNTLFIENTARIGGALGLYGIISSNTFENTLFINNHATENGGAINVGTWDASTFSGNNFKKVIFINNSAVQKGGVLYVNGASSSNTFDNIAVANNTGNQAVYISLSTNDVIKDSIFMNNNANIITTESGSIELTDNWFGNNATNYDEDPNVNANLDNWLFLNATANPAALTLNETSTVTFKFYSYKNSAISEYNGPLNVFLDLSSTLGTVDKTNATIGEEIIYTASESGNGTVKAQFENKYYTITLENNKIPTKINLTEDVYEVNVDDTRDNLAVLQDMDGNPITGEYVLNYTSNDTSVVTIVDNSFTAVGEGIANITVSFNGTDDYAAAESKYITVKVSLIDTRVTAENMELKVGDNATISYITVPENLNVSFVVDNSGVVSVTPDGNVTALKNGTANITINVGDGKKYARNSTTITVTVSKIPTTIKLTEDGYDVYIDDTYGDLAVLQDNDGNNITDEYTLTYTSENEDVVKIIDNTFVAVGEGIAIITVSFNGTDKYEAAKDEQFKVSVNKIPTNITVENATLDLNALDNVSTGATLTPADAGTLNYTSSNPEVAEVKDGKIFAYGAGNTTITVSFAGDDKYAAAESKTIEVTVTALDASVSVNKTKYSMYVDDIDNIVATTDPAGLNISYATDDDDIIQIDEDGQITALAEGTATIFVSVGDNVVYKYDVVLVNVTVSKIPTVINLTSDGYAVYVDESHGNLAVLQDKDGNIITDAYTLTYTSDNEDVVKIVDNTFVAVGEGIATITVSFNGTDKYEAADDAIFGVAVFRIPTEIFIENTTLAMKVDDEVDPVVSLKPSDAGNLSFIVSDESVVLVNGYGIVTAVGAGNATVTVSFKGNDKYAPSKATISVSVTKVNYQVTIRNNDTALTVEVPEDATGNITLIIGDETLTAPIENGTAIFDLSDVPAGDYNTTLLYDGNNKYAGFEIPYPISIVDDFIISADDLIKYYGGSERFVVNLTDGKGNPIANATVTININGKDNERTTDEKGQISMGINLNSGEYPVVVTYQNTTVDAKVTVLPTVNGTDVVKIYRNGTQYYATFRDSEGNYLKDGATVRFNINGVFYDRQVSGDKGLAKLNINLEPGSYVITAMNIETGENAANNITVLASIVENNDITKYYRNGTQYTVKILGADGNPVGAGETVKFNINGVIYERQTNESGIAKLNINLQPGDYVITAEYNGCTVSNNIKVLPVLSAEDMVKMYGTPDPFVATLIDGQGNPYADQSVTFNINGVFYTRYTNSAGEAELNINLMPGLYIITSSYDGSNIANNVLVIG